MKLKIGKASHAIARPHDLEQQLIAASGLNAAETARFLRGNPQAHHVARALRPFLGDSAPDMAALAQTIAGHGVAAIAVEVAELLEADATEEGGDADRKDNDDNEH